MAIDVSKYKAKSNNLVAMLLPYFLHGNKVLKFLSAIVSPLDDDNHVFSEWAKDKIIDAVTTSQPIVLKWCLDNKLNKWFKNKDEHFRIDLYTYVKSCIIYNDKAEYDSLKEPVTTYLPEDKDENVVSISKEQRGYILEDGEGRQKVDIVSIVAPAHISTISDKQYIQLVKQIVELYRLYEVKYEIKIKG